MAFVGVANLGLTVGEDRAAVLKKSHGPVLPVNLEKDSLALLSTSPLPRGEMTSVDGKVVCEDRSLTALLPGPDGKPHAAFAVVADGISQKMLHAERGSALASLAAFSVCKQLSCDQVLNKTLNEILGRGNPQELAGLVTPLLDKAWQGLVKADMQAIVAEKASNPNYAAVGWTKPIYDKAIARDDVRGYGTTLLFAYHNGTQGFVMKIGDGGVVKLGHDGSMKIVSGFGAKTSDAVDSYLVGEKKAGTVADNYNFQPRIAGNAEVFVFGPETRSIALMSDGPEETLAALEAQKNGVIAETVVAMDGATSKDESRNLLAVLAARPGAKTDDYSFAVARAPKLGSVDPA